METRTGQIDRVVSLAHSTSGDAQVAEKLPLQSYQPFSFWDSPRHLVFSDSQHGDHENLCLGLDFDTLPSECGSLVFTQWGHALLVLYPQSSRDPIQVQFNWPEKNNSVFLFRDQTKENMFWGIVSGCGIWTLYEAVTYWMFANGYMLFPVNWLESPIYCTLLFIAIPFIRAHHFYFTHRWTHWKPLYRIAHYLHHKYTNTGPWSGLSMHPIEHLIYFSGVALHWIIPSHPVHALFHAQHTGLAPVWGHSGFEKIVIGQKAYKFHDNFHFLHHRYFECNYGAPDTPFDHWFDTWHEGTEEATVAMKERLKQAVTPKEA